MQWACSAPLYNFFSHVISQTARFSKEKVMELKMCFFFSKFRCNISHSKRNSVRYYHKCTVHQFSHKVPTLMWAQLKFSRQIFKTHSNIKFHANPSSESRVVPCGRTDITIVLIVAFQNYAKTPKNRYRGADKSLARPGRKQANVCQNGVNFLRRLAL